ncbi:hypothetical protein HanRHA438_Chr01g0027771 [Helianthus annuus]|nr:hypothetical protein HanRHA438_Chr01g0027771 [Helianthus annuus]
MVLNKNMEVVDSTLRFKRVKVIRIIHVWLCESDRIRRRNQTGQNKQSNKLW